MSSVVCPCLTVVNCVYTRVCILGLVLLWILMDHLHAGVEARLSYVVCSRGMVIMELGLLYIFTG